MLKASQALVSDLGMRLDENCFMTPWTSKPWLVVWVTCMEVPVTHAHVSLCKHVKNASLLILRHQMVLVELPIDVSEEALVKTISLKV